MTDQQAKMFFLRRRMLTMSKAEAVFKRVIQDIVKMPKIRIVRCSPDGNCLRFFTANYSQAKRIRKLCENCLDPNWHCAAWNVSKRGLAMALELTIELLP